MIDLETQVTKISEIKVHPRQRKDIGPDSKKFWEHVDNLAESIKENGLFHPIILDEKDHSLVMGFTRIQAFMKLGRDEIPYRYGRDLSQFDRKRMELEENIQRLDLEWWEEAAAIAELHELYKEEHGEEGWTVRKTAALVGKSAATVQNSVALQKEVKENPDIKKEKTLTGALNKVKTKKQIETRKQEIAKKKKGLLPSIQAEIVVGDALELIQQEEDESFDAIVTNFPFGVDLEFKDGEKPYHDEEDYIVKLVRGVVHESYRVLRDDSWFVGFFDIRKITYSNKQLEFASKALDRSERLMRLEKTEASQAIHEELSQLASEALGLTHWFEEAGFDYVSLLPDLWVKPNKTQGMIGDPRKGRIVAYEAFVFAGKGDPVLLKQGLQNIWIFDTPAAADRVHPLQMNTEFTAKLVSTVALGGARILDPFAGSGSIGLGALDNQCEFKGYELDPEKASNGNLLLSEHVYAGGNNAEQG